VGDNSFDVSRCFNELIDGVFRNRISDPEESDLANAYDILLNQALALCVQNGVSFEKHPIALYEMAINQMKAMYENNTSPTRSINWDFYRELETGEKVSSFFTPKIEAVTSAAGFEVVEDQFTEFFTPIGKHLSSYFSGNKLSEFKTLLAKPELKTEKELIADKEREIQEETERLNGVAEADAGDLDEWESSVRSAEDQAQLDSLNTEIQAKLDNERDPKEVLRELTEFLVCLPVINDILCARKDLNASINSRKHKMIIDKFMQDNDFIEQCKTLMEHDNGKYKYHYHGTSTIEDAKRTIQEGLYMSTEALSTTSYPEFTLEQILLLQTGYDKSRGDFVVIFKEAIDEHGQPISSIVKPLSDEEKANVSVAASMTGSVEMNYVIDSENIVGFIDKIDRTVSFGKGYKTDVKMCNE